MNKNRVLCSFGCIICHDHSLVTSPEWFFSKRKLNSEARFGWRITENYILGRRWPGPERNKKSYNLPPPQPSSSPPKKNKTKNKLKNINICQQNGGKKKEKLEGNVIRKQMKKIKWKKKKSKEKRYC